MTPTQWSYVFPATADVEGDSVSVTVSAGSASFLGTSSSQISIADLSSASVIVGSYSIAVIVEDASGSTSYTISLEVQEDPCILNGIPAIAVPDLSAYVYKTSSSFTFSAATVCGTATFALNPSSNWLTLS